MNLGNSGRVSLLFVLLLVVGCDHMTKHVAVARLEGNYPRTYLSGFVRLQYAENTGAFLSLGAGLPTRIRTGLLTFGVAGMLIAITGFAWKYAATPTEWIALGLIVAGGASNLFDRVAHGSVVDFINIGIGSIRTGIFNVADVAILFGVCLYLIGSSFASERSSSS